LKTILEEQGQAPLYIVMDALDECPNSYGLQTQREEVLEIVKELVELKHPHVHFCVTSRPEIDIRRAFDSLNPYDVSLHNQPGQIEDIAEYVKTVVGSDATMQNWPINVKELVIDTLTKKSGGMYVIVVLTLCVPFSCDDSRFRWAYCQLETLRQCPLRYISSTLGELPKTLDETYERILQGIPEKMRKDAHRIFQWIMVSSRPLCVEEVAEVFAINFDEEISGIPKFEPAWRDANAETAVLSACSTLVTIVDGGWRGKIVQFSHFSVQEYLTSDRVANAEHVSRFHLRPKPAHTLLAKSCLSVLLHLDYTIDEAKLKNFPLAEYTAEHWVEHAQFEDVSSCIWDGIDLLFDEDQPHLATWVWVCNMYLYGDSPIGNTRPEELYCLPLYYAALFGFSDLVERLLTSHPQDIDAEGGDYGTPLNAALDEGHLDIAQFLLDRGAVGDNVGSKEQTGLYIASSRGYTDVVRSLIDRGADLNAECKYWDGNLLEVQWTPLHAAISGDHPDIALLLLERGANPETRSSLDQTALCMASSRGHTEVVRSLIDRGADLNAKSDDWMDLVGPVWWTPLHAAIYKKHRDIVLLLLEGGADTETRSNRGETALYLASSCGRTEIMRLLFSHGADPNARVGTCYVGWTPLHAASHRGRPEVARMLVEHGANPNALDYLGGTALHIASKITVVELLLEYGVNVDVRDKEGWTPLHKAAWNLNLKVVVVLLDRGADPHAVTKKGETPFQLANAPIGRESKKDQSQIMQLLSERTGERI
jgi:ankyrin repeat protein